MNFGFNAILPRLFSGAQGFFLRILNKFLEGVAGRAPFAVAITVRAVATRVRWPLPFCAFYRTYVRQG